MKDNSYYTMPVLCDYGGDLNKRWFIAFDFTDQNTNKLYRKQFSHGMNYIHDKQDRYTFANNLLIHYKNKLATGWNPVTKKVDNLNDDELIVNIVQAINFAITLKSKFARKKTIEGYNWVSKMFFTWLKENYLQYTEPTNFTSKNAHQFMDQLLTKKNYGPKSFNNVLIFMRGFFNLLIDKEIITINPFKSIKKLPAAKGKIVAFDDQEMQLIDCELKNKKIRLWYYKEFMYCTGIRRTELTLIKVRDIQSDSIIIYSGNAKNKSQQSVMINQRLQNVINQMELDKYKPDDYVFGRGLITCDQQYLNPNHISTMHTRITKKLKIREECTLYSWKHTGAGKLYEKTKDPYLVMRHLRHHSLEMTVIYLRSLGYNADANIKNMTW